MGSTGGRRVAILLATASVAVTLSGSLIAGEWFVRHRERTRSMVPEIKPLLFYPHRRLRHALVRDYDYFGWAYINADGFRGRPVPVEKPPGTTRIMAVGASTTFDNVVSGDDRAWPARLEYWLHALDPTRRFEVINAGVPGYRVLDNLIRLQTELHRYGPDVIILYHGHNDLFDTLRGGALEARRGPRPDAVPTRTPWNAWLSDHSLLYAKVLARWRALRFAAAGANEGTEAGTPRPTDVRDGLLAGEERFERDLASFVAIAGTLHIPVVLVRVVHISGPEAVMEGDSAIRAMWRRAVPYASPDDVLRGYRRFNATIGRVAERFDQASIETAGFGLEGPEWYFPGDPIHFNDRGAERMGRAMAEALLDAGVFDPRSGGAVAVAGPGRGPRFRAAATDGGYAAGGE